MKILKIQKDVLETIADSELRCNVRYCYNSDTGNIGISPDGATCYFIPKDQFFLSTEGITNIDRDTFFKAGLENSILSIKDVQTYQLTRNHSVTRLSRIFNDSREVYVKEEYLKPFSKKATFYIPKSGDSYKAFVYVMEPRCGEMPCWENLVGIIAPIRTWEQPEKIK